MAESGPGGPFDTSGELARRGSDQGAPSQAEVSFWLARWRERLPAGALLPEDEARFVIESVLHDMSGGRPEHLDRAGRAWGRAHRSVSEMVSRLSSFREALTASGVADHLRMHRALDRVTAAATEEVLHRLERASRTDALTGVGNRRAFDETLSAALSAAARQGHEVTVVAIDLDGLKRINDTEGHAAGDAALLAIVRACYSGLRDEDTVFRVGGDEFVVLLPFTSVDTAELLMGRIRASGAPAFTWGAAGYPRDGTDAGQLVEAADRELYRRRQGRPAPAVIPSRAATGSAPAARRGLRWAWIPAAAVLVASLVATLVSAASGPVSHSARRHAAPPAVRPGHGGSPPAAPVPTGPQGSPAAGSGAAATPPAAAGVAAGTAPVGRRFVTVGAVGAPGTGAPQGGSAPPPPGSGSPPPSGGGTPPPTGTPPPPSQGGLLGLLEGVLAPVPGVGGSNGLLATVGQVIAGPAAR